MNWMNLFLPPETPESYFLKINLKKTLKIHFDLLILLKPKYNDPQIHLVIYFLLTEVFLVFVFNLRKTTALHFEC